MENSNLIGQLSKEEKEKRDKEIEQKEIKEMFPTYENEIDIYNKNSLILKKENNEENNNIIDPIQMFLLLNKLNQYTENSDIYIMKDIEDELPFISLISSKENNKDNLIWYSNQILNNENLNNNNNEDYIYSTLYNSFSFYKFASQLTSNNIINEENETLLNKDKISISLKNTNNNLCFNFYKSSSPSNSIMLYYPINILISKCKDYLNKFTEHPILNNILFICNSILSLDISETPLSKILSILDVLINSIHEWETYASKSINSLGNELNLLMKLIRYFRYIEIQSWKNFLL